MAEFNGPQFIIHAPGNLIGASEVAQNKEFLNCYLLATHGVDFYHVNLSALVKDFATSSGVYSEACMNNIVGACYLLHQHLPRLKRLALDLGLFNYVMLRTLWNRLVAVPLDAGDSTWNIIDEFLVHCFSPTRQNQALPTPRQVGRLISDELVRLGMYDDIEAESDAENNVNRAELVFGVELIQTCQAGVSIMQITMPSDEAYEAKIRLEQEAKERNVRQDEIALNRLCGEAEVRENTREIRIFGFGELIPQVLPEITDLHGVGKLTAAQRERLRMRNYKYEDALAVAEICRSVHNPTIAQRLLVMLRDGTCRFPGCNIDARFCEIDHIINHEVGGWTTLSNLQTLCKHHHNFKTDRHACAHADIYGAITWRFATGLEITTLPKGPLGGKIRGLRAGIDGRHAKPTKPENYYLEPPANNGFGRWGTTLIRYREKQRRRHLERTRMVTNIDHKVPKPPCCYEEEPLPEGFEPPPDPEYQNEPPIDWHW